MIFIYGHSRLSISFCAICSLVPYATVSVTHYSSGLNRRTNWNQAAQPKRRRPIGCSRDEDRSAATFEGQLGIAYFEISRYGKEY